MNLDDGKPIGGIGRLRDKDINRLQNYSGIVIRYNTSDIHEMKKVLEQCFSTAALRKMILFYIFTVLPP